MKTFVWPKSILVMAAAAVLTVIYARWLIYDSDNYLTLQTSLEWAGEVTVAAPSTQVWKLTIPKDYFVTSHVNWPSWRVYRPGGSFTSYVVHANLNHESVVIPNSSAEARNTSDQFTIELFNNEVVASLAQTAYCLPEHEALKIRTYGKLTGNCDTPVCFFEMSYRGWRANVAYPKSRNLPTEQACQILRKTLDAWTTHIDDLRKNPISPSISIEGK